MTILYLYIVAASSDPDHVECLVPYLVDEEVFFGPCKRRLRSKLRDRYLGESDDLRPQDNVFVVGVNGSNRYRLRKIVWAGQISRLMTFEVAYRELSDHKYQEMRSREDSPLHLRPLYDSTGKFKGYEHRSLMHKRDEGWIRDLIREANPMVQHIDNQLLLTSDADRYEAFPRDCCFLLENIFFAQGSGIPITDEILAVLKRAQPEREKVDSYAIFGYRSDKSVDGRTGRWLEMYESDAEGLIHLIQKARPSLQDSKGAAERFRLKPCRCR